MPSRSGSSPSSLQPLLGALLLGKLASAKGIGIGSLVAHAAPPAASPASAAALTRLVQAAKHKGAKKGPSSGVLSAVQGGADATQRLIRDAGRAAAAGAVAGALIGKFKKPASSPSVTVLKSPPQEADAPNMATAPGATVLRSKTPVDVSNPVGLTAPTMRMTMPSIGGSTSAPTMLGSVVG